MDIKKSLKDVIVLLVICSVFAVVLAAVNSVTAPIIADRLAAAADEAYLAVMPGAKGFENVDITQYTLPSTVKEVKKEKKDETKWFNKEDLERLEKNTEYLKKFATSDDLLKDIQKFYAVSKDMKLKIADARANVPEDK